MNHTSTVRYVLLVIAATLLVACGEGEEGPAAADDSGAVNHAPTITGSPPTRVSVGVTYAFAPEAGDVDGDALVFGVDGKPDWLDFEVQTGRLSGTPGDQHVGTHRGIVVWVSDGSDQTLMPAFDVEVMAPGSSSNAAPVISGSPRSSVMAGTAFAFTPTANDADGDALVFAVQNLPSWATFNAALGRIAGTPAVVDAGRYEDIVISVHDGQDGAALSAFDIVVTVPNVNTPPTIAGQPAAFVLQGTSYVFQPVADDADGDSLSFAIQNGPPWASFSSATGRLSGTPGATHVGIYTNVTISVSDGLSTVALPAFTIQVTSANAPPTISGNPSNVVLEGAPYVFQPSASDADGDPLTFSITGRPAWASFDSSTGRLSGTPGASDVGTHSNIAITVSDGAATASLAAFSITVTDVNDPPTISGSPPTTVLQGQAYSFQPSASDPDGDVLVFTIQNRPTWASFSSSTGRLQGTPTASHIGQYGNIRISVSDGTTSSSLGSFAITVTSANTTPIISGTPPAVVLPGQPYSFQPTASDPDGDTLMFTVQNRPAWAAFDSSTGALQGTPSAAHVGTYSNIEIRVSDGTSTASLTAFSITVQPVALGSATLSWQAPTANVDGSPLVDLAGYKIYWGTSSGNYANTITINNPGLTTYVVDNLTSGTYYFATSAFNAKGAESALSNETSKTIP